MLSTAGVVAIHCNDCWPRELHDCRSNIEIHAPVRPSVCDQWPVRHAADVKSDRWHPLRPHKWCGPPTSTCLRARGCGPRHASGWSAAVHGSSGHEAITLTITAGENCRSQTRSIESLTSPRKFISLNFPGINNPKSNFLTFVVSDVYTSLKCKPWNLVL